MQSILNTSSINTNAIGVAFAVATCAVGTAILCCSRRSTDEKVQKIASTKIGNTEKSSLTPTSTPKVRVKSSDATLLDKPSIEDAINPPHKTVLPEDKVGSFNSTPKETVKSRDAILLKKASIENAINPPCKTVLPKDKIGSFNRYTELLADTLAEFNQAEFLEDKLSIYREFAENPHAMFYPQGMRKGYQSHMGELLLERATHHAHQLVDYMIREVVFSSSASFQPKTSLHPETEIEFLQQIVLIKNELNILKNEVKKHLFRRLDEQEKINPLLHSTLSTEAKEGFVSLNDTLLVTSSDKLEGRIESLLERARSLRESLGTCPIELWSKETGTIQPFIPTINHLTASIMSLNCVLTNSSFKEAPTEIS